MALRGDFAKLRRLTERIESLGSDATREALAKNMAEEGISLIAQCFRTETDPYGKRWPAKVFGDGNAVLVRSNELRRGWHPSSVTSKGFRLSPSATASKYAKYTLGTGLWGPKKARIVPKNGSFLAFFVKGYVTLAATRGIVGANRSSKAAKKSLRSTFGKKRSGSFMFLRSVKGSPPRLMVPNKERGLPEEWRDAFSETAHEFIQNHLKVKL
jgi:hypothetical protein